VSKKLGAPFLYVELTVALEHGLSGAWIVRGKYLCGVVYAAYDHAPYLHMIPAHVMFENIADAFRLEKANSAITVANARSYIYRQRQATKDKAPLHQSWDVSFRERLKYGQSMRRPHQLGPLPKGSELANDGRIRWTIPSSYEKEMKIMRPMPSMKTPTAWTSTGIFTTAVLVGGAFAVASPIVATVGLLAAQAISSSRTSRARDHLRHISVQVDDDVFCQDVYTRADCIDLDNALWHDASTQKAKGPYVIGAVAVTGVQPPPLDHVALAVVDTQVQSNYVSVDFARRLGWDGYDAWKSASKTDNRESEVVGGFEAKFSLLPRDNTRAFQPLVPSTKRSTAKFLVVSWSTHRRNLDIVIGRDDIVKYSLLCI
jgi:hypothetical protein